MPAPSDRQRAEYERALEARRVLASAGVPLGADFHTLGSGAVDVIVAAAKRARYRKPRNANGSTGRYYHALLQRRARGTVVDVVERLRGGGA